MNGKAHALASVLAAVPTALLSGAALGPEVGLGALMGCVAGVFITPDVDQIDQVIIHHGERKLIKWLPGIGYAWLALWDPYARVCPHRHALSHLPVLGTVGRAAYIRLWLRIFNVQEWPLPPELTGGLFIGLFVSDLLHWIMDGGPIYVGKDVRIRCLRFLSASASGSRA